MIPKTFKSITTMAIAVGFAVATLASCGAKKEEAVEEAPMEEVAPSIMEEMPADTTMMDTTGVDSTGVH